MKTKKIAKIILECNYDNMKSIRTNKYEENQKKLLISEYEFIKAGLKFLEYEELFNDYNKMDNDKLAPLLDHFRSLGYELNNLQDQLKIMFKDYQLLLANINEKKPLSIKCDSAMDAIYNFILLNLNLLIFNSLSSISINTKLNKKFVYENESFIDTYINFLETSSAVSSKKTGVKGFNTFIKEYHMLSKIYEKYGKDSFERLSRIDDLVSKNNQSFNKTNLINAIFRYNNLANCKTIFEGDKKEDFILQDIVNPNGNFKDFTEEEIADIIISFFMKYNSWDRIVSDNMNKGFRDLSSLSEMIKRRKKDSCSDNDIKRLIDDVASGVTPLGFKDKSESQVKKLL